MEIGDSVTVVGANGNYEGELVNGHTGTIVAKKEGRHRLRIGIDFHKEIRNSEGRVITHFLDGSLKTRTGHWVDLEYLVPSKLHNIKRFYQAVTTENS